MTTLGDYIRELRVHKCNWTMREAANAVDVAHGYWSDIEHNNRVPSNDVLPRIASQLGGKVSTLRKLASAAREQVSFERKSLVSYQWSVAYNLHRRIGELDEATAAQIVALLARK